MFEDVDETSFASPSKMENIREKLLRLRQVETKKLATVVGTRQTTGESVAAEILNLNVIVRR